MPWWAIAVLVFGGNFTLWGTIGLFRLIEQCITRLADRCVGRRVVRRIRAARAAEDAEAGRVLRMSPADPAADSAADPAADVTAPLPALPPGTAPPRASLARCAETVALPALPVSVAELVRELDAGRGTDRGVGALARRRGALAQRRALTVNDVAVLIPAHNEALVIEDSIQAVLKLLPPANVHVVSDGSTDDTYEIAAAAGVHAIKTHRNVGKAGALREAIQRLEIVQRFPVVMLLDADTRVQPGYFEAALPMFDDPGVVAVAGCVRSARDRRLTATGNLLVGHRQRIYAIGQRLMKFGQTWRRTNATHIVPGFASIYRTAVLPRIEMNPPGLVIEDFNMTFEVYQKRLGKVGFSLSAIAVTEDPDTFRDYVRQTRRWALGLWQTVRRHPPRLNLFSGMLALLLLELVSASLLFLMLPLVLLILVLPYLDAGTLAVPGFATVHAVVAAHMSLRTVLLGVGVPDYAMTILAAVMERQPRLLLYGFLFPVLRVVDAAIGISAIPLAWLARSTGRWTSPARRALPAGPLGGADGIEDAEGAAEVAAARGGW